MIKKIKKATGIILFLGLFMSGTLFAQWNSVGLGSNLDVKALAADTQNKVLYVGGTFTQIGGVSTLGIAKWNGVNYAPLGQGILSGTGIYCLLVQPNGDLVAGGTFTNIDGILSKNIARWNGANWSPLGLGLDSTSAVIIHALAMYNGELYAGGIFNNSGGSLLSYIAKWNGSVWQAVGGGTNGIVRSLCVYNNELYAGGTFTNAGGVAANNIARWNGMAWSNVGGGCSYTGAISVSALQVYNGSLYAGGTFTSAGTTAVKNIARWDGSNWWNVGGGASYYTGAISVSALQVHKGNLITGGTFDTLGTLAANFVGSWNGTSWTNLSQGMNNSVYALASSKDTLYAGGLFTTAGGNSAPHIAQWNAGVSLSAVEVDQTGFSFNVYPVPATRQVMISFRGARPKIGLFTCIVSDALGREVYRSEYFTESLHIERSNFSAGVYMYKIVGSDKTLVQEGKIIFRD